MSETQKNTHAHICKIPRQLSICAPPYPKIQKHLPESKDTKDTKDTKENKEEVCVNTHIRRTKSLID